MPQEDRHIARVTVAELEERLVAQGQRLRELEEGTAKRDREIERLKTAAKPASAPASALVPDNGVPKGCQVLPDGFVVRGSQRIGKLIGGKFEDYTASASPEQPYEERQRQKTAQHSAAQDAFWARATEDAPAPGCWRAPDGLWRTKSGAVYSPAQKSAFAQEATDFEKASQAPGGYAYMQRQALRKD